MKEPSRKFKVSIDVDRDKIISTIQFEEHLHRQDAYEYAFYLYKDGQRIGVQRYSSSPIANFSIEGEGTYSVGGFTKLKSALKGNPSVSSATLEVTRATHPAAFPLLPSAPPRKSGVMKCGHLYLMPNHSDFDDSSQSIVFRPRRDLPPYPIKFPLDWDIDPFSDENWRAQLHMWRLGDFILISSEKSPDSHRLRDFMGIICDWHRHHLVEKLPSKFAWQDMMVGMRAMKLAFVISKWQHGQLTLAQHDIECLSEMVEAHLEFLLNSKNVRLNNHTLSDLVGARALAEVVDTKVASEIEQFVDVVFRKLLASQFSENGVHRENSTGYQKFAVNYLQKLRRSGWFKHYGLNECLEKSKKVLEWFYLPDGRLAPIGDTSAEPQRPDVQQPIFKGRDEVFNKDGYVVIKDDGGGRIREASYFLIMGASHTVAHKQADDLSFIWHHGEDLIADPGKYAYLGDAFRKYVVSRRAHNTIDSHLPSDGRLSAGQYGNAIRHVSRESWGHYIVSKLEFARLQYVHYRFFFYSVDGWLLVIDRINSQASTTFTQWTHFAPALEYFRPTLNGYDITLASGRSLNCRVATLASPSLRLIRGQLEPDVQGWVSEGYRQITPSTALAVRQDTPNATFATLYSLNDPECEVNIDRYNELCLSVKTGSVRLRIQLGVEHCKVQLL